MSFEPTYDITLGSYRLNHKANNRLVEVSVEASLQVPVNVCYIRLPQLEDMPLEKEMPVTVNLGYGGRNTKVFTGLIHHIGQGLEMIKVTAMSSFRKLVARRENLYFENPTAASVVLDICQQAGVTPGRVDTGMNFSFYTLGSNHSYYEHLRGLAAQCGFTLYADTNDHLFFGRPTPLEPLVFEVAKNVLALQLSDEPAKATQVEVYGESPASLGQGTQGAYWLTKKEVRGSAGASGPVRQVFSPTIRTLDNASRMAQALQQQWKARKKGKLTVLGVPDAKIGDTIRINKMPGAGPGALFEVTGFTHRLEAKTGFITQLNVQEP